MREFQSSKFTQSPLQILKTAYIDAPIEKVWEVVADHQGMTQWVPMIKHVELTIPGDQGDWGEGCERQCQFGPDLLKEKIVHWDPPYGYAYSIEDMHLVKDHVGHIALERVGDETKVTWRQYFQPNGNLVKNLVAKHLMMPNVMKKALKNLAKKAA